MTIVMYDSITLSEIPASPQAVAGYVNGNWPTFSQLAAKFPKAQRLSIAVSASANAEVLDIETGDATASQAPAWIARQRSLGVQRPCLYANASTMEGDALPALSKAGIARSSVRLWTAHYTDSSHICGPSTCEAMTTAADGTQWTCTALGRNLDESVLLSNFFATEESMEITKTPPGSWEGTVIVIGTGTDGNLYETKTSDGKTWTTPVKQ